MPPLSKPMNEVFVVFSAMSHPGSVVVHKSLKRLLTEAKTVVITSRQFKQDWENEADILHVARFSLSLKLKRLIKAILNRSFLLRRLNNYLFSNFFSRWQWLTMPPHNARHFESLELVRNLPFGSWVFLVDSRDLVFQIDPFKLGIEMRKQADLHFFDERIRNFKTGSDQKNESSPANWNWSKMLVNGQVRRLSNLGPSWIINSGCISGTREALIDFLEKSCKFLSESLYSTTDLLDQASTNFVVYENFLNSDFKVHANGEVVLNMCGKIESVVEIAPAGLRIGNYLIPIIHQFDRFGSWDPMKGFNQRKEITIIIFKLTQVINELIFKINDLDLFIRFSRNNYSLSY